MLNKLFQIACLVSGVRILSNVHVHLTQSLICTVTSQGVLYSMTITVAGASWMTYHDSTETLVIIFLPYP